MSKSKSVVTDRRISPIMMAFACFWFVFNWKVLLTFIFSEAAIDIKITYIESMCTMQSMLIYPAIVTALFLVVYPFLAYHVYKYYDFIDKRKQLVKLEHECEVMEAERKRTKLKRRLKDSEYNSEVRIERDRINHRYLLAERKYALKMKKLEYEAKSKELHKKELLKLKQGRTMLKPELSMGSAGKRL